jgi:hypothetical protein
MNRRNEKDKNKLKLKNAFQESQSAKTQDSKIVQSMDGFSTTTCANEFR